MYARMPSHLSDDHKINIKLDAYRLQGKYEIGLDTYRSEFPLIYCEGFNQILCPFDVGLTATKG